MSWLVLEGSALLFEWCEPLSVLGHGGAVVEFLAWGILAVEAMVNLSTVKVPQNEFVVVFQHIIRRLFQVQEGFPLKRRHAHKVLKGLRVIY